MCLSKTSKLSVCYFVVDDEYAFALNHTDIPGCPVYRFSSTTPVTMKGRINKTSDNETCVPGKALVMEDIDVSILNAKTVAALNLLEPLKNVEVKF